MFTWECPSCGKELDVDAQRCPQCGAEFGEPEEAESIITDPKLPASSAPPPAAPRPEPAVAPVAAVPPIAAPPSVVAATPAVAPPKPAPTPPTPPPPTASPVQARPIPDPSPAQAMPPPATYGIQGKHLAVVLVVLLIAIAGAVYLARPDLFRGPQSMALEEVPVSDTVGFASAAFGDLQVAGVRPLYTDDMKTQVRFVVINHGETPQAGISMQAHLSPREAPLDSPPLASFAIEIDEALAAGESREIEADLMALSTLAAFPPWKDLRIDLEVE